MGKLFGRRKAAQSWHAPLGCIGILWGVASIGYGNSGGLLLECFTMLHF